MNVEIITTGTELLLGEIINENSRWLASFLNEHGYSVIYITTVGDNFERMKNVMSSALSRADIVITSGGLGATQGDITKNAGAQAMGVPYVFFKEQSLRLKKYYAEKGRNFVENLDRQAWFAENSFIMENHAGSANGSILKLNNKIMIHLPGPPFEMRTMAEREMMPWLDKNCGRQGIIHSVILPIHGLSETDIEIKIMDLIKSQSNPTLALLARPGYIALRITSLGKTKEEAEKLIAPIARQIKERLPGEIYHIEADARKDLISALKDKKMTLSAAESCTGGLIGKMMSDFPGSSAYFQGSAVTYQNEAKENILGISPDLINQKTAVSAEVAVVMAESSRRLYQSDIAVSTTGYAGPGNGESGERPGLVYIAVSGKQGTKVYENHFMGDRRSVRYGAAEKALYYALNYIKALS